MSSLSSTLGGIQKYALFSVSWVYVTLGLAGCLLNICLFCRRQFRTMSCCTYFLAAAVTMAIQLVLYPIPNIYGFFYANPLSYIRIFCKTRMYIIQITVFIYRWSYAIASVDRYILSSPHARLRRLATVHIAYRVISLMAVTWLVVHVDVPILYDIKAGVCGIYIGIFWPVFISTFSLVVGSFAPAIVMIIFALLIRKSLAVKRQRRPGITHQDPTTNRSKQLQQKRDQQALRMLFAQIIVYLVVSIPWNIYSINTIISTYIPDKTPTRIVIEEFINAIATAFAYLYPGLSFYVYTLTSNIFRRELSTMLRSVVFCKRCTNQNRVEPMMNSNQPRTQFIS